MTEQRAHAGATFPPAGVNTPHPSGLRPQKRMFIVLSIVMVLWIGALLTMYFTTVWPQRHRPALHEIDVDDHHPTTMTG